MTAFLKLNEQLYLNQRIVMLTIMFISYQAYFSWDEFKHSIDQTSRRVYFTILVQDILQSE